MAGLTLGRPSRLPSSTALLSPDSLADHAALELGKRASNLKHQLSGRRGGDRLLIEVQIDAAGL